MEREVIERIFTVNLGVKGWDRVLVFADTIRSDEKLTDEEQARRADLPVLASEMAEAGRKFCDTFYAEYPATGSNGAEPPLELWEAAFGSHAVYHMSDRDALKRIIAKKGTVSDINLAQAVAREYMDDAPAAVIALSNYSTSHTIFRRLLTEYVGTRYASLPSFERYMLKGSMSADWEAVRVRTEKVVSMLEGRSEVEVSSPNGTRISFSISGRRTEGDTGILTGIGAFGNLPAGEAYLAPVEGTAKGTLVLEWSPARKLSSPVTIVVNEGRAVKVNGSDPFAGELADILEANPEFGNIAELGIGTNDKASRPDNILEAEKILGTIHIALGDNSGFGGKVVVPFHQDFIFFKPTVEVVKGGDKLAILKDGEPQF